MMAYMEIQLPEGTVGDIEAALIRSGFGVADSVELADLILESNGVSFGTNRLGKAGIDPAALMRELRQIGLLVRWTGQDKGE
jgi:hypothetical protein